MCVVCGTVVKSAIIWQAHVNKRSHLENLTRLKQKQQQVWTVMPVLYFNDDNDVQDYISSTGVLMIAFSFLV